MKLKSFLISLAAVLLGGALVYGVNLGLGESALARSQAANLELMRSLLPGSERFTQLTYEGEDENIRAVWQAENGYLIESGVYGYADDIVLWVGVDGGGSVTGLVVRSLHETYGLGAGALSDTRFLSQFLGTDGDLAVGEEIVGLTGATVTSKAITKAVNSACAYVTGADIDSSATEWGVW